MSILQAFEQSKSIALAECLVNGHYSVISFKEAMNILSQTWRSYSSCSLSACAGSLFMKKWASTLHEAPAAVKASQLNNIRCI